MPLADPFSTLFSCRALGALCLALDASTTRRAMLADAADALASAYSSDSDAESVFFDALSSPEPRRTPSPGRQRSSPASRHCRSPASARALRFAYGGPDARRCSMIGEDEDEASDRSVAAHTSRR